MANEDPAYLSVVRRQYCCAPGPVCHTMPCEPHHPRLGVVGAALKGHDRTAIPLCPLHHRELHSLSGVFKSWDGVSLRVWQQDRIAETQARCIPLLEPLITPAPDDIDIPF